MAKIVKKKKLKLKKKNFLIFILCNLLIISLITHTIKSIKINHQKQEPQKEEKKKEENTKENTKKEEKENNPKYYKKEYETRYKKYQRENPELTNEDIITQVNIGLDYNYYENSKESKYPNKSYILVNKYNYVAEDYIPKNLEKISNQYALNGMQMVSYAKEAFEKMAKEAKKENLNIIAMSTYRSYEYQVKLYNEYKKKDGQTAADKYSARAGYSEHQTGLAVDVYNGKENYTNFESTEEFDWMEKNAYKYGFILRFPKNKEKETGYQYESWHYRYVGIEIATYIKEHNISFEEYYVQQIEI